MNKFVQLSCIITFILFSLSLVAAQSSCQASLNLIEEEGWTEDHTPQRRFSVVLTNTHNKCTIKDSVTVSVPHSNQMRTSWGLLNSKLVGFSTLAPGQSHSGIGFIYSGYGTPSMSVSGFDKCECTGDVDPSNPTTAPTVAPGTDAPTSAPTEQPTEAPTTPATMKPTLKPTAAPTNPPTFPPADAPSYHLDLKFLVLTCNGSDHRTTVATHALEAVGSDYHVVDFLVWGNTAPFELTNIDGSGKYYAIVSTIELFCWSTAQVAQIVEYENIFRVKTVILYSFPYNGNGVTASTGYPISNTDAYLSFAPAFEICTHSLNFDAHIPVKGVYVYKASISDTTIATPAVYFTDGAETYVAAAFIHYKDGRERLEFYVDQADWALYPVLLGSAWLEWATNGVFAGARRIEFNAHMDDIFMSTGMFDPAIGKEGEKEVYRISTSDVEGAVAWQTALNVMLGEGSNFTLTFPYNGATVVKEKGGFAVDPLYLKCKELRNHFIWESHTYEHPYLDNMTYSKVKAQYVDNDPTAKALFDVQSMSELENNPIYCSKSTVTPSITGLFNPGALRAMYEYGIRFVVGDNSRKELLPFNVYHSLHTTEAVNGLDGIYIIPRHATNIYYDASLPHNIEEEWDFHYGAKEGAYTLDQVVAKDVAIATSSLLAFRHDPFMFHQANLRISDEYPGGGEHSLLSYWVDHVIADVRKYTDLPIRSHSHDLLGQMYLNREARDVCGFQGKLKIDKASNSVTELAVSSTGDCIFPISGFETAVGAAHVDFEVYGSEKTSWLSMTPGASFTLTPKAPVPRI